MDLYSYSPKVLARYDAHTSENERTFIDLGNCSAPGHVPLKAERRAMLRKALTTSFAWNAYCSAPGRVPSKIERQANASQALTALCAGGVNGFDCQWKVLTSTRPCRQHTSMLDATKADNASQGVRAGKVFMH